MMSYHILGQSSTLEDVFFSRSNSYPVLYDLNLKAPGKVDNAIKIVPMKIFVDGDDRSGQKDSWNHQIEPESDEQVPCSHGSSLNCFQVLILSIVVIIVLCFTLIFCRRHIKEVLTWMEGIDIYLSCIIYLCLFITVSFPLIWGYLLLIVSAGYLYGLVFGVCTVTCCAFCGVLLSHIVLQRTCNKRLLSRFYNDKIDAIVRLVESDQGFKIVMLARLTPLPFGLQNALFSMTTIPLVRYCAASTIGLVPMAFLNCYLGSTLRSMKDVVAEGTDSSTAYLIFSVQILLTIGFMVFVLRRARQELAKTVERLKTDTGQAKMMNV